MPETELERVTDQFIRALNRRDWTAVRALLADDVVIEERRPARGFADIRGADEFVERLKTSIAAVPDRYMGQSAWIARRPHAGVSRNEFRGHDAIGGGEVSSDRIAVQFTADDRYRRLVFFEPDDEAGALTYFNAEPASS